MITLTVHNKLHLDVYETFYLHQIPKKGTEAIQVFPFGSTVFVIRCIVNFMLPVLLY